MRQERPRERERDAKNTRRGMDGKDDKRETRMGYSWGAVGVRVGYDLPRISPSGVRVGYGWGTVGVQVGYAGKFSVNRL